MTHAAGNDQPTHKKAVLLDAGGVLLDETGMERAMCDITVSVLRTVRSEYCERDYWADVGLLNTVAEHLKICFLAEGKPFPYAEKLMRLAPGTKLGRVAVPILQKAVDLVLGRADGEKPLWERLEKAFEILNCYKASEDSRRLDDACGEALMAAGIEPGWWKADYDNIEELLLGELGPAPD